MGPQHKRTQYEVVILKLKGFSFYPSRPVVLGIPVLPSLWDCPPIQQSTNGGYSKLSYRPWVWTRAQKRSAGMFFVQVGRQSAQLLPIRAVYSDSELGTCLVVGPPQASIDLLFQQIHLQVGVCTYTFI
jgi:hypothetical protein